MSATNCFYNGWTIYTVRAGVLFQKPISVCVDMQIKGVSERRPERDTCFRQKGVVWGV